MSWLVLLACASLAAAADYKLPADVKPRHYKLQYVVDVDPASDFSYFAVVEILLTAKNKPSSIVLHAQDLTISYDKISLQSTGASAPAIKSHETNDGFNFLKINLGGPLLEKDNYTLTIPFSGNLKRGLEGVYISSYVNRKTNIEEYLVTTQFEAISARKGFPCFDEPMLKATFQITIGHHKDFSSVSNMPVKSSVDHNTVGKLWPSLLLEQKFKKPKEQFIWDQFETTVPMSTYLVAFVVSKFAYVESPRHLSKTRFRIWARRDAIDQTAYASIAGPKVLSYYEKLFNVSFPLPKQDMFAIPDFAAGAMENWGLITYRETMLLYDPKESSVTVKEEIAEVIAHELAHQWFGNLVTMKWWTDLWLKEGFATFVAGKGVDAAEPTWKAMFLYSIENIQSVLALDALESSHPVSVALDNPETIDEIYDQISYAKGSVVIRMMTMFLGEEVFRKAIHNYLVKYSYSNAVQDDLWCELTTVSKEHGVLPPKVTVKDIMDTWTTQTGYPILKVVRNYDKGTVSISQSRFVAGKKECFPTKWWIPLTLLRQGHNQSIQWISNTQGVKGQEHQIDLKVKEHEWLLLNPDMIAPLRVNYDSRGWEMLATALATTGLPVSARVQLLNDAFALAASDLLDYDLTLKIANYLQNETEYMPLKTGLHGLFKMSRLLLRQPSYGIFQKYMRRLISDTYYKFQAPLKKRQRDEDDLNRVKMQELISDWACNMMVPGCENYAIKMYKRWMDTDDPDENNPIPREQRSMVYCAAMARGGVKEWRWAVDRRVATNVEVAREQLMYALSCTREVWLLATLLEWTITPGSEVRQQDAGSLLRSVVRSSAGYYLARDFIYQRFAEIDKALDSNGRTIGRIVAALLEQFTTQRELDDFLAWHEKNKKYFKGSKLQVQQGIENAKVNIAWMNKYSKHVVNKMRGYSKGELVARRRMFNDGDFFRNAASKLNSWSFFKWLYSYVNKT